MDSLDREALRIVDSSTGDQQGCIVIGKHIRATPDLISDYCLARRERVFEDLATIAEGIAFCDRRIVRKSTNGWKRDLSLDVPVYEPSIFQTTNVTNALRDAVEFLTGDCWAFHFSHRVGNVPTSQTRLTFPQAGIRHVIPFSDGLDSFAQARLSIDEHGPRGVLLVRAGLGNCGLLEEVSKLRVPRRFGGGRLRETTYRTRPLVFYTLAAVAAAAANADAVVIGENGQGALGPACIPFADEWWFRSAHPGFVARWRRFLALALKRDIPFVQPQLWKTKGEVLTELRQRGLSAGWQATRSCSGRPVERLGRNNCGFCGGCLLRIVAAHAAGIGSDDVDRAFDVFASESVGHDRSERARPMTRHEYAIATRAVATMHKAANFSTSDQDEAVISHEARRIAHSEPEIAKRRLKTLLQHHAYEWNGFLGDLPSQSWIKSIIGRL